MQSNFKVKCKITDLANEKPILISFLLSESSKSFQAKLFVPPRGNDFFRIAWK